MMYQVPEEVPAPQIMTKMESGEAYQQRYGLAFKMEHGFQRTEMGQQAYAANLAIISQAVLRTVYARLVSPFTNFAKTAKVTRFAHFFFFLKE